MSRMLAAATALLTLVATPALADDQPTQVCLLRSTQTLTAPKKPDIFETKLDCGRTPTPEQERLAKLVHNAMDTADALEIALAHGYTVRDSSWRDSYTGRQILAVYTLVGGGKSTVVPVDEDLRDADAAEDRPSLAVPVDGPDEDELSEDEALERAID